MGCIPSDLADRRRSTVYGRRNTLVSRPKVKIDVGECISNAHQSMPTNNRKVLFIFGGPGSGKGTIVNNLLSMYGFHLVCSEDVILDRLIKLVTLSGEGEEAAVEPLKVRDDNVTKQMTKYIMENPDKVTRKWLFEVIQEEVLKYPIGDVVIIDIVPNLKFLLRSQAFAKKDDNNILEEFDLKMPIAFAIDLALDKDHLISNIQMTHACTKALPAKGTEGDKGSAPSTSDEMDTSRTERRFNIYINSVSEFLDYFNNKGKLLKVDTSSGDVEAVWMAIRDYVVESEVAYPISGVEQIVLFQLGQQDFLDIDIQRYPMKEIHCSELTDDHKTASPEKILKKLAVEMRKDAINWKTFHVDCADTMLSDEQSVITQFARLNDQLVFLEEEVGTLDFYMHGLRRKTQRKKSIARKNAQLFRTITTSNNEALIFPLETESEYCRMIALGFLNAK